MCKLDPHTQFPWQSLCRIVQLSEKEAWVRDGRNKAVQLNLVSVDFGGAAQHGLR
jgi:hypothetical protein